MWNGCTVSKRCAKRGWSCVHGWRAQAAPTPLQLQLVRSRSSRVTFLGDTSNTVPKTHSTEPRPTQLAFMADVGAAHVASRLACRRTKLARAQSSPLARAGVQTLINVRHVVHRLTRRSIGLRQIGQTASLELRTYSFVCSVFPKHTTLLRCDWQQWFLR